MCEVQILILKNLDITLEEQEKIIELTPKIKMYKEEGNNKKIMQLINSNILFRIHFPGKHKRMVFSYENKILKVYEVFIASDEKEKIRTYDRVCDNEKLITDEDFFDITPEKKLEITKEELNNLKRIKKSLEDSTLIKMRHNKIETIESLGLNCEKHKWIRKYSNFTKLFDIFEKNGEKIEDIFKMLDSIKNRSDFEKLSRELEKESLKNSKIIKTVKEYNSKLGLKLY